MSSTVQKHHSNSDLNTPTLTSADHKILFDFVIYDFVSLNYVIKMFINLLFSYTRV